MIALVKAIFADILTWRQNALGTRLKGTAFSTISYYGPYLYEDPFSFSFAFSSEHTIYNFLVSFFIDSAILYFRISKRLRILCRHIVPNFWHYEVVGIEISNHVQFLLTKQPIGCK